MSGTDLEKSILTACVAIGDAALNYFATIVDPVMRSHFGTSIIFTHVSGCDWETDTFDAIDLDDGAHDYTFKLNWAGTDPGDVVITLEDEV